MFAKRAKPGAPRATRKVSIGSESEGDDDSKPAAAAVGQRRKLVALGPEDDNEAPVFKVKKSKMSRQMAATKAPVEIDKPPPEKRPLGQDELLKKYGVQSVSGSRKPSQVGDRNDELVDGDEGMPSGAAEVLTSDAVPGFDGEEEDEITASANKAGMAARLARAQRAAARELGASGGGPPGANEYIPLTASQAPRPGNRSPTEAPGASPVGASRAASLSKEQLLAAAQRELNAGEDEDEPDFAEAWAQQQMRVGAHSRFGSGPKTSLAEMEFERESTSRRGAEEAERVAMGLHGQSGAAPQEKSTAKSSGVTLLAPGQAMAKLWESMKGLEGGAGERTERLAELKGQCEEAQVQLEEIQKQDKKLNRSLKTVQELEEFAWSLGGLLDAKAGKVKQATQMMAQMEEDFTKKRARRRLRHLASMLRKDGASLSREHPANDDEEFDEHPDAAERRLQRRRTRRQLREAKDEEGGKRQMLVMKMAWKRIPKIELPFVQQRRSRSSQMCPSNSKVQLLFSSHCEEQKRSYKMNTRKLTFLKLFLRLLDCSWVIHSCGGTLCSCIVTKGSRSQNQRGRRSSLGVHARHFKQLNWKGFIGLRIWQVTPSLWVMMTQMLSLCQSLYSNVFFQRCRVDFRIVGM
eukprot:TRINITY_DN4838_c0_g1_i5.p1 TRINITY_DN4838_c0_g1~~TRINITY_DN4838_c0_g1_i5.p1  ORF type:complete len:647 (-),score=129.22 TRINITY_DN4838_c0_g1_i5:757-2661(-)